MNEEIKRPLDQQKIESLQKLRDKIRTDYAGTAAHMLLFKTDKLSADEDEMARFQHWSDFDNWSDWGKF